MALGKLSKDAVLAALNRWRELGRDEFLSEYRFGKATRWVLVGSNFSPSCTREDFSGGPETIEALRAAGFELERKDAMADELRSRLERVLAEYETARVEQVYGAASPMWSLFKELGERLERTPPVLSRTALSVSWSVGAGSWARVPWISFLDSHETDTTQRGVYPVLLFRQDLTGVYLTLAQGVTEPKKTLGRPAAVAYLQGRAQRVRDRSPELTSWGFALDGNIDLHADPGLGKDYEVSTIAHKLYERGDVPPDDEIIDDLDAILRAYDNYIETRGDELSPLAALAEEFRETRPYPSDSDKGHAASREELAEALSSETLTAVEADPSAWELVQFSHFAGSAYGGPGPQSSVHTGVIEGGDAAKSKLARTLRYLLYETEVGECRFESPALTYAADALDRARSDNRMFNTSTKIAEPMTATNPIGVTPTIPSRIITQPSHFGNAPLRITEMPVAQRKARTPNMIGRKSLSQRACSDCTATGSMSSAASRGRMRSSHRWRTRGAGRVARRGLWRRRAVWAALAPDRLHGAPRPRQGRRRPRRGGGDYGCATTRADPGRGRAGACAGRADRRGGPRGRGSTVRLGG